MAPLRRPIDNETLHSPRIDHWSLVEQMRDSNRTTMRLKWRTFHILEARGLIDGVQVAMEVEAEEEEEGPSGSTFTDYVSSTSAPQPRTQPQSHAPVSLSSVPPRCPWARLIRILWWRLLRCRRWSPLSQSMS